LNYVTFVIAQYCYTYSAVVHVLYRWRWWRKWRWWRGMLCQYILSVVQENLQKPEAFVP